MYSSRQSDLLLMNITLRGLSELVCMQWLGALRTIRIFSYTQH
jgi:hypothetical protein